MADLDDLNYKSITEMTPEEGIELIRQIRLSRRVPVKKPKKTTSRRKKKKAAPKVSSDQAAELLKLLTGGK